MDLHEFLLTHTRPQPVPLLPGLRIYGVDALVPLWEATEVLLGRTNLDAPYWAVPWAGGIALARWLCEHPEQVVGRRVLDFACGSGLAGLQAARLGAGSVAFAEIDPLAHAAVALNAGLNGVAAEVVTDDLLATGLTDADVVLAGDVFYSGPMSARVEPFLRAHAAAGRLVLVGDPGRKYLPQRAMTLVWEGDVPVSRDWEDREIRRSRVWQMRA